MLCNKIGKEKLPRRTTYVVKRNRYLFHGRNNTQKICAVARTKQREEDNCCFTVKSDAKNRKKMPA